MIKIQKLPTPGGMLPPRESELFYKINEIIDYLNSQEKEECHCIFHATGDYIQKEPCYYPKQEPKSSLKEEIEDYISEILPNYTKDVSQNMSKEILERVKSHLLQEMDYDLSSWKAEDLHKDITKLIKNL